MGLTPRGCSLMPTHDSQRLQLPCSCFELQAPDIMQVITDWAPCCLLLVSVAGLTLLQQAKAYGGQLSLLFSGELVPPLPNLHCPHDQL